MYLQTLGAITSIGVLCACGGSSTSGNVTARYTTLKAFSDGAGVARGVTTEGQEAVFILPEVQSFVAEANANPNIDPDNDDFDNLPVVSNLPYADVRGGTVNIDGVSAQVIIVEDKGGDAELLYAYVPGAGDLIGATGSAYGSAPNGTFEYNGTHAIGRRSTAATEVGTFAMSADFNNKTFDYSGGTTNSSLTGGGTINTTSGRFSSDDLASTVGTETSTATMYGQFHGSSAQSTSGVFHTNESDPTFAGGFAGSR